MSLASTALDRALNMLGPASKQALLFHLKEQCGLAVDGTAPFTFEQLRLALERILGPVVVGVILEGVLVEMDELAV